jgi:hypothetical protein
MFYPILYFQMFQSASLLASHKTDAKRMQRGQATLKTDAKRMQRKWGKR